MRDRAISLKKMQLLTAPKQGALTLEPLERDKRRTMSFQAYIDNIKAKTGKAPDVPACWMIFQPFFFGPRGSSGGMDGGGLMQFRVFGPGLLQDGDLWIGVLPQSQKLIVGRFGPRFICYLRVSSAKL